MTPKTFQGAVSNWVRAMSEDADVPRHTCGSAERMYADHPERGGREVPSIYVDRRSADVFEKLVAGLPEAQRRAWHLKNGFRGKTDETEEWINEHYNQARAQLSVWWSLSRR